MRRVRILYSGRVQGVGFRYTACDVAYKHKIAGWVRNCPDGRVEVAGEGAETNLNNFLDELRRQMSRYITGEKISWEPASGEFKDFKIN